MPMLAASLNLLILRVFGRAVLVLSLTAAGGSGAFGEEDPYLSAISREAKKVDVESQPSLAEPGEPQARTEEGLDLQAFEEDLKARYMGSYTFYQKLPRRSREEVFLEYRDGASIDDIRKKIMDRFLHQ